MNRFDNLIDLLYKYNADSINDDIQIINNLVPEIKDFLTLDEVLSKVYPKPNYFMSLESYCKNKLHKTLFNAKINKILAE